LSYTKTNWSTSNLTAANLNNTETQYDEAVAIVLPSRTDNTRQLNIEKVTSLPAVGNAGRVVMYNDVLYVDTGTAWRDGIVQDEEKTEEFGRISLGAYDEEEVGFNINLPVPGILAATWFVRHCSPGCVTYFKVNGTTVGTNNTGGLVVTFSTTASGVSGDNYISLLATNPTSGSSATYAEPIFIVARGAWY